MKTLLRIAAAFVAASALYLGSVAAALGGSMLDLRQYLALGIIAIAFAVLGMFADTLTTAVRSFWK